MFSMSARPMNTMLTAADIERHRKRNIPTLPVWRPPSYFRCRTMSAGVGLEFIGLADIENLEITFRISFLSTIEREIQVLPV
jgi:hypothetical protein